MWIFVVVPVVVGVVMLLFGFQKKHDDSVEAFADITDEEKLYENRLFVIKTFDSLSKKPTAEQLTELSKVSDRIEVMRRIIELTKREDGEENALKPPPLPLPLPPAEAADKEEGYRGYALVSDDDAAAEYDEPKKDEKKPENRQQARRYIREMYAALGKLDDAIA